ncbi:MAG: hypothetical protein ACYCZX_08520 [Rhodospirillaceae bacterium]
MKDIGNYKLLRIGEALARLDGAVGRLEAAADAVPHAGEVKAELESLTRDHAALKETADRVATRLDVAIARLAAAVDDKT